MDTHITALVPLKKGHDGIKLIPVSFTSSAGSPKAGSSTLACTMQQGTTDRAAANLKFPRVAPIHNSWHFFILEFTFSFPLFVLQIPAQVLHLIQAPMQSISFFLSCHTPPLCSFTPLKQCSRLRHPRSLHSSTRVLQTSTSQKPSLL